MAACHGINDHCTDGSDSSGVGHCGCPVDDRRWWQGRRPVGFVMAESHSQEPNQVQDAEIAEPPFFITMKEEEALRVSAGRLNPSAVITQASSFDEYTRQLLVPPTVMDLARKASGIHLSSWEVEGIRAQLEPASGGLLRRILEEKIAIHDSHPPYIRVACTGRGDYDDLASEYCYTAMGHHGDAGSPVVLEIWPAQHYSPVHSHGGTTGIIYCLTGQVDVMLYSALRWDAKKLALVTLTPGQCAWLAGDQFSVHKVHCPMDGGRKVVGLGNPLNETSNYAATLHVYLNEDEAAPGVYTASVPGTREAFSFIDEKTRERRDFIAYSDLSWHVLRGVLANHMAN
jgi:hypothetical protein